MSASGNRLARTYTTVDTTELSLEDWPATSEAFIPALHDLTYFQGLLKNEYNFIKVGESQCTILEVLSSGEVLNYDFMNDTSLELYLKKVALQNKSNVIYRVVQLVLSKAEASENTSFRHKISVSGSMMANLMHTFNVSPQFQPKLLGEPDYLAPGVFVADESEQQSSDSHVFCQHPRWDIHKEETALSVYMTYSGASDCTTYIIAGSENSAMKTIVDRRLKDWAKVRSKSDHHRVKGVKAPKIDADPLFLHCMISQASLDGAKPLFNELRHKLYDVLDEVDKYAQTPYNERRDKRRVLEEATVHLHDVSQNIDSTIASLEMAEAISQRLDEAHEQFMPGKSSQSTKNAISYLNHSHKAQIRWLRSWKSRKDIAMNLVFNLVTQQDAASSHATALAARADGNSMKAIATLTMIFLPATYMATLYGITAFRNASWQSYWIITVPLTLGVVVIWMLWVFISSKEGLFSSWEKRWSMWKR